MSSIVPISRAESFFIEVKSYIPLDFDNVTLQEHLSTQCVVGTYLFLPCKKYGSSWKEESSNTKLFYKFWDAQQQSEGGQEKKMAFV